MTATPDLPAALGRLAAACDRASDRLAAEARRRADLHLAALAVAALLAACTGSSLTIEGGCHGEAR